MMNSVDYVKNILAKLVSEIPNIKCNYEYDVELDSHTIEILPSDILSKDSFVDKQFEIIEEFRELYEYEGLYFIGSESYFPITNPIFSLQGNEYLDFSKIDFSKVNFSFDELNNLNIFIDNPDFLEDMKNVHGILEQKIIDKEIKYRTIITPVTSGINISSLGEANYALAA